MSTITIKAVSVCRNEKRAGGPRGIHKQVSIMLNIKLTVGGGGGLFGV